MPAAPNGVEIDQKEQVARREGHRTLHAQLEIEQAFKPASQPFQLAYDRFIQTCRKDARAPAQQQLVRLAPRQPDMYGCLPHDCDEPRVASCARGQARWVLAHPDQAALWAMMT